MIFYEVTGTQSGDEVSAVSDGRKIGYLKFSVSGGVCTIDDMLVQKEFRHKGIGSMMVLKLWDYVYSETGASLIEAYLPRHIEELEKFLLKFHFYPDKNSGKFTCFTAAHVLESRFMKDMKQDEANMRLSGVRTQEMVDSFRRVLDRAGWEIDIMDVYRHYDQFCSIVRMSGREAVGFSLVRKLEPGRVLLSYVYLDEAHRSQAASLLWMTALSIKSAYGEDTVIETFPSTDEAINLVQRIVPLHEEKDIIRYYQYLQ